MKKLVEILITCSLLVLLASSTEAGNFVSGSTGADGPFNPPTQVPVGTTIDGSVVTVPLPANGIFNFTTITIPSGTTVKFQKNAANTPVYILTTGDVNIAGAINISGENGMSGYSGNIAGILGGKGGPGGFDGGWGGEPGTTGFAGKFAGYGLGPGGGGTYCYGGLGGSFGTLAGASYGNCGSTANNTYGIVGLYPLIGGSGGSGGQYYNPSMYSNYGAGGGGGGAILIASSGNINITGAIYANGGNGGSAYGAGGGGGSGGGIKLIGNRVTANLYADRGNGGPSGAWYGYYGTPGGYGRIRVEAYTNGGVGGVPTPSIAMPGIVFLPQVPTLLITKIAGNSVPASASGSYTTPDITLPSTITNPISVEISASNIPAGTSVTVTATPQHGTPSSTGTTLIGTDASSTATANIDISMTEPSVITAQTTFTVQTAMFFDGEKIEKVRVASSMGKGSEVTYITETGKEIPAEKLMAKVM